MNLFGALEAHAHQHANELADLIAANKESLERAVNIINVTITAELTNTEARRAAMREQWELMDINETNNHNSRIEVLKGVMQDAKDRHDALDQRLTALRNIILSGDFKPNIKSVTRDPTPPADDPADLELLPPSVRAGTPELSVNET